MSDPDTVPSGGEIRAGEDALHGGCLCGAVRFAARGEALLRALCHCGKCRRAAGAPAVAWAMFPLDSFTWTRGAPVTYASSPGAARGFCGTCGTTLSFTADFIPGLIDVTIASFDEPALLPPELHMWDSKRLPWLALDDDLPRHPEFPPQP